MKSLPCLPAFLALLLAAALSACSSAVKHANLAKPASAKITLSEGYSLLYHLMKDESNLDKILWIKDANPAATNLIKKIAEASRNTKSRLETLALEKPSVNLATRSLPEVEAGTRDAIAKSTASSLLSNSGKSFELRLLLTQVQAMNYASHLCQVLAASESNAARRSFLQKSEKEFQQLREQAIQQIAKQ